MGGQQIAGGFVAILEGIQGDQDYIRTMMYPSRPLASPVSVYLFGVSINGGTLKWMVCIAKFYYNG